MTPSCITTYSLHSCQNVGIELGSYDRVINLKTILMLQARDVNGLRAEHYAVDSCEVDVVRYIFDKGGDVTVRDSNGWTPLFRACTYFRSLTLGSEMWITLFLTCF